MFKIILLSILAFSLVHCTGKTTPTAKDLYKGLDIPQKREFKLSEDVSPCENFHKYVCSNVEKNFELPADRRRWTFSFSDNAEKLLYAKKQFFKDIKKFKPKTQRSAQFKDYYLACMNKEKAKKEEKAFINKESKYISNIESNEELADVAQYRIDKGLTAFSDIGSSANKEDPSLNDAYIISDMRSLPERSYYKNKELIKDFKKVLIEFYKTVGMGQPEKRADWLIDFETRLAEKAPLPHEIRGRFSEDRDISRKDFLKKYSNLKLKRIIKKIPEKTVLVDIIPETNEFLSNALKNEDLEVLKSVYAFHSMVPYLDDAYPSFFQKYFDFQHKYLGGPEKRADRQERCTKLVMDDFGMELDYVLMDILFPDFPEAKAVKVAEGIRKSIIKGLEGNTWLNDSTKKEAIKKIKRAKLNLVKPKKKEDWNFMPVKKYSSKAPYKNRLIYSITEFEHLLDELKKPRNPNKWYMSPLVVNAYYASSDNKFVLPQGILQFPFFSDDLESFENTAAIGTVVGHELGHGIDDKGSKYDFEGKVRQWFTKEDLKNFKQRGERFIKQFNEIGHNGQLTLGENIGDHVGLTFSYQAAFPKPEEVSKEDKQKFFVSYARLWCGVATPSYEERQLKTDPHALGRARINQQVIHQAGFQEAFGCQAGDKMFLPKKDRIRIW